MSKAVYKANIEFTQNNIIKGFPVEFITEEKNIDSISDLKQLNKIALRYVKQQNKGEIEKVANGKYTKLCVRGVTKTRRVKSENNRSTKTRNRNGFFNKIINILEKILD